jgi:DNA topoisomerase I
LLVYLKNGRFGPFVELGIKSKGGPKPRSASIPKNFDTSKITLADALKFLTLPRELGADPKSGKPIIASVGRFGPYIMLDGDFRSLKAPDDVYTIELPRALEILAIPKKSRGFGRKFAKKKEA